jgi:4-hydroxythreonine-4-phosphate dehydrogenase
MSIKTLNKIKLVFVGDLKSINLEIIAKSHKYLVQEKIKYILIGDIFKIKEYFNKIKIINEVIEIFNFSDIQNIKKNAIFVFNIHSKNLEKSQLLLNQINISNNLAKLSLLELVTMPINKSAIKKDFDFNGMTEYLKKINNQETLMLMRGEKFSIIPLTTHIKFKDILNNFNEKYFYNKLRKITNLINNKIINYNEIIVLGVNPHAGENGTLGNEEIIMKKIINKIIKDFKFKKIRGPLSADSAFQSTNKNQLFISFYHDQALIPFKILNKKSINHTIGLSFNRLSPAHGTAEDIIFKNLSDNTSYIQCMLN